MSNRGPVCSGTVRKGCRNKAVVVCKHGLYYCGDCMDGAHYSCPLHLLDANERSRPGKAKRAARLPVETWTVPAKPKGDGRKYTVVGVYKAGIGGRCDGEGGCCYGNSWAIWVRAKNPQEASKKAKKNMARQAEHDVDDLGTIAVFGGWRKDLFDCPVDE